MKFRRLILILIKKKVSCTGTKLSIWYNAFHCMSQKCEIGLWLFPSRLGFDGCLVTPRKVAAAMPN